MPWSDFGQWPILLEADVATRHEVMSVGVSRFGGLTTGRKICVFRLDPPSSPHDMSSS
jgi:hypothetical protein